MSSRDGIPSKRAAMSVVAATIRNELQFMVRRMAAPTATHDASVKAQLNKVSRLTGLPPRRLKDFRNGYLNKIPAHEDHTIRAAYQKWLKDARERARAELQSIEAENERLERTVADYASARFHAAVARADEDCAVGRSEIAETARD